LKIVLPFCDENMPALLSLLINKYGQKKGDRHPYKYRAHASGSKKRKKQEAKMREEEVAAKSRNIQVAILQWQ